MRKRSLTILAASGLMLASVLTGCAGGSSEDNKSSAASQEAGKETDASKEDTTDDASKDATDADPETTADAETDENGETKAEEVYTLSNLDPMTIDYSKYVDVSGWRDVKVTKDDVTEPKESYEANLRKALASVGFETSEVDDAAIEGDTVKIDFTGYMDGEAFENGSAKDYEFVLGSGSFIPGFQEGLVGLKAGETKTLDLTFPDPYTNEPDYSGKPVKFDITLKSVKRIDLDSITDDQVKELIKNKDGESLYETYEEFITDYNTENEEAYRTNAIWKKVMEEGVEKKEVCTELSDDFINTYLYTFSMYSQYYGVSINDYLSHYGYNSVEDFKAAVQPAADEYASQTCAVLAIAAKEGIEAEQSAIDEKWNELLTKYDNDEEALKKDGYMKGGIEFDLLLEKVRELVMNEIKVQ